MKNVLILNLLAVLVFGLVSWFIGMKIEVISFVIAGMLFGYIITLIALSGKEIV